MKAIAVIQDVSYVPLWPSNTIRTLITSAFPEADWSEVEASAKHIQRARDLFCGTGTSGENVLRSMERCAQRLAPSRAFRILDRSGVEMLVGLVRAGSIAFYFDENVDPALLNRVNAFIADLDWDEPTTFEQRGGLKELWSTIGE